MSDRSGEPPPGMPPPTGPAYDLLPAPVSGFNEWQRLSPLDLLLFPIASLTNLAIPIALAVFGFGRDDSGGFVIAPAFLIGGLIFVVVLGVVPWLTTRYRLTESQLQVRRGLLNRTLLTAPLDRVRSVDLESTVLHRMLRMSKVSIGTGVDSSKITLDALTVHNAERLQAYLLARKRELTAGEQLAPGFNEVDEEPGSDSLELARIDWSWLRYAPFSLASLVVVAGLGAVLGQLPIDVLDRFDASQNVEEITDLALPVVITVMCLAVILGWLALSTVGYVISWWNLTVTRMSGGTLQVRRGLLTTTSTTVEEAKIRGVTLREPALLRLVNGAELFTVSTGVGDGQTKVLPPCPQAVAQKVGHDVLQETGALTQALVRHGRYARRRCYFRGLWGTIPPTIGGGILTWYFEWVWWIPVAVFVVWLLMSMGLAEAEYRNLGHGVTEKHLVSAHGTLGLTREVLEQAGVIGWVIDQSFFQRRVGLSTLIATTAAGAESIRFHDIPLQGAIALAAKVTPEVIAEFAD